MIKNAFYFTLKALFVLKKFKFLSWLFGHVKNCLIRKIRLISKFVTWQPGQQTIKMHKLSTISRMKGKQTIKFGKLIEVFKFYVEKLFWGNYLGDPLLKFQNWVYLWINSLKLYTACFYCMLIWGQLTYSETKPQTTCF